MTIGSLWNLRLNKSLCILPVNFCRSTHLPQASQPQPAFFTCCLHISPSRNECIQSTSIFAASQYSLVADNNLRSSDLIVQITRQSQMSSSSSPRRNERSQTGKRTTTTTTTTRPHPSNQIKSNQSLITNDQPPKKISISIPFFRKTSPETSKKQTQTQKPAKETPSID